MLWIEMRRLLRSAQAGAVLNSVVRVAGRVFLPDPRGAITVDDIFASDGLVAPR